MSKDKRILGLVVLFTTVISITSIAASTNSNNYGYQLNTKNILPAIETNKAVNLVFEHIEDNNADEEVNLPEDIDMAKEENEREEPELEQVNRETDIESIEESNQQSTTSHSREIPTNDNSTVTSDLSQHLNNYVLDLVKTYDYRGGNYPYLLNNDFENYNGVTEDIYYKGEVILKAHPSGKKYSHCTGISFEVFFKAMQNRNRAYGIDINDFNGMSKEEMMDFMLTWYVATGPKSESNLAVAIEKYGLGSRITNLEEVAPGDFIDLSRENNTGHAVVFIDWIRQDGKIIGIKHWSSQQSTNGISHKEEYFNIRDKNGEKYGNVILDSLNIARVSPISEYR